MLGNIADDDELEMGGVLWFYHPGIEYLLICL